MTWPLTPRWPWPFTGTLPWDDGITWRTVLVSPPDELPVSVDYIRDHVLRAVNGTAEDLEIRRWIRTAEETLAQERGICLGVQTWAMILDGAFPTTEIKLMRAPLIDVLSVDYVDSDGDTQTLTASPAEYQVVPSGSKTFGRVRPVSGSSWPTPRDQADAVTVTFRAGYEDIARIPERYITGIGLMVAELYKLRSLSVQTPNNTPAQLQVERFWPRFY